MDIKQEINKHLDWMDTVASLLGSKDITDAKIREISRHDQCALGRWLKSDDSAKFQHLPEFEKLRASHDAFHNLAGELITALEAGDEANALDLQDSFIGASQAVIGYLSALEEYSRTK